VKAKIREKIERCKRRMTRRLSRRDLGDCSQPTLTATNIHYEIADRARATSAGGIAAVHQLVERIGLPEAVNRRLRLLKMHLPYHESDHVLSIAYNLLAGGTCLEHLELLRNDEAYLNALGARRIPDPTTAGDFCRRFDISQIITLMDVFNATRVALWQRQPKAFRRLAVIEADGTMVETTGECKQGMDINYKGQWGYHPLLISLANTGEPLYVVNRPGNRPSHEHAAVYLDRAIALCRRAGFKKILLRGDTDFTQTAHLDRWDDAGDVQFIFGIDAMSNLYEIAEKLPKTAWKELVRRAKYVVQTQPRQRPQNVKEKIVEEREFQNIRLTKEYVAEFRYQPAKCDRTYRVVVVWKDLDVCRGQQKLFDDQRCFFYITNDWETPTAEIVFSANKRCNQENVIQQLKSGVHSFAAPVDNLLSNWAYMVMASLAWSLKAWMALLLPDDGRWREKHREEKRRLLRMDFATFRQAFVNVPAQIVRTGRKIVCRLLAWNPWQHAFFRLLDQLALPLRQ
jgi:hypothetical protein